MKPWGLVPNSRFEDLTNDLLLEKNYKKEEDQTHSFVSLPFSEGLYI
jgi:hypothetical protein